MGDLFVIEILIVVFIGIASMVKGLDKDTKKLILQIDGAITGIFIIVDLLLLFAGLKNYLI